MSNPANRGLTRRAALQAAGGAALAPVLAGSLPLVANATAPMLGPSKPSHYRFRLGQFEVTALNDGALNIPRVHPIFGKNKSKEEVAAYMGANNLPGDKMSISFSPILVNTGSKLILFDTGYGDERRGKGAGLAAASLSKAGYRVDQVDMVVITHCHPDHVSGLMEGDKPVFPNAEYVVGAIEYNFWSAPDLALSSDKNMVRRAKAVQANLVPLANRIKTIKPGEDIVTGIRSMEAFGHTPGHMVFHMESGSSRLLLWADTTNHYVASLQQPDWHVIFDMDKARAAATRKRILDMVATEKIPATGYHMPFPAVGYVEKKDSGFRWVPVSYQLDL